MKKTSIFADSKRREILKELENNPKKFVELKKIMKLDSNLLSYNLNILIKEKLVSKEGFYYSLTEKVKPLMPYVHNFNDASLIPLPCIAVVVMKDDKILIRKKSREPGKGKSIFIGGKMHLGEDILESARRHVREKVGIKIKNLKFLCVNNYVSKKDSVSNHFVVFFVRASPIGIPKDAVWKNPNRISGEMFPDNNFVIKNMLNNKKIKIISSIYDENISNFKVVNVS